MKKLLTLVLLIAFTTPLFAQDTYTIKVATLAPEGSMWMKVLNKLKAKLKKDTKGRLKLRVYAGGVLGDDKVVISKMRLGQVDAASLTGVGLGAILPEIRAMEIPFQIMTYKQYDCVLPKLKARFEKKLAEKGFVTLGWADQGFVYMMSRQKITKADDIKKTKPWVWEGDPLAAGVFRMFGINPVPLSLQDVFTSLQTDLIDTVYITPVAAIALQWNTKLKYIINQPIVDGLGALIITKKAFDKLPDDIKVFVKKDVRKYMRILGKYTRKFNTKSLKVLQKKGMTMLPSSADQAKIFKQNGMKAADKLVGTLFTKKFLERTRKIINECAR